MRRRSLRTRLVGLAALAGGTYAFGTAVELVVVALNMGGSRRLISLLVAALLLVLAVVLLPLGRRLISSRDRTPS